jgi:hypothetical protein
MRTILKTERKINFVTVHTTKIVQIENWAHGPLAQQCSRAIGPSKSWAGIFLVGLHVPQQIILKEKFYCSLLKQPKEHYEPTTHSRMAQPRVRIGPMAHSRSGAPGTPGLRRGPNNDIRSFQSDGQALSTDEQNPSVGSHHGTLAHFVCFSSLSHAPHRASQHRQSASKRMEPALSGITVWLTSSTSFSAVESLSPSSSHTVRL